MTKLGVVRRRPVMTVKILTALERGPNYAYRLAKELKVEPRQKVSVMLRRLQHRLLVRMTHMEHARSSTPRTILELTPMGRDWLEKNRKFAA